MTNEQLLKILFDNKDDLYKKFNEKIINTHKKIIGVRTPVIRKIAKKISKGNYESFLLKVKHDYHEQILVEGLVISSLKDISVVLNKINNFTNLIDNWAVCDMVVANCKIIKNNLDETLKFIQKNINSINPWKTRVCFVMLLNYFVSKKYLNKIFYYVENDKSNFYYIMMSKAWLISECYIKFPEETIKYLKQSTLDKVTYNKAISKICDSYRVPKHDKIILRNMKKKSNNA